MEYIEFLRNKMAISHQTGFEINSEEITPTLYPHVKDTVRWAVAGGTSTGVNTARLHGEQCAEVIACVNHDANAIASHEIGRAHV